LAPAAEMARAMPAVRATALAVRVRMRVIGAA
jgi:hypothetical protein